MAKGSPRQSDDLSPRPSTIRRDMTTWSFDALADLLADNTDFALYVTEADHEAVFFGHCGRPWLFCSPPAGGFEQAAPELIEDWIGSLAAKEPGTEPMLIHRAELPSRASKIVDSVVENPPEHVSDTIDRVLADDEEVA